MTPVRSGECFQGSDTESSPKSSCGGGVGFGGREVSLRGGSVCRHKKTPEETAVEEPAGSGLVEIRQLCAGVLRDQAGKQEPEGPRVLYLR